MSQEELLFITTLVSLHGLCFSLFLISAFSYSKAQRTRWWRHTDHPCNITGAHATNLCIVNRNVTRSLLYYRGKTLTKDGIRTELKWNRLVCWIVLYSFFSAKTIQVVLSSRRKRNGFPSQIRQKRSLWFDLMVYNVIDSPLFLCPPAVWLSGCCCCSGSSRAAGLQGVEAGGGEAILWSAAPRGVLTSPPL